MTHGLPSLLDVITLGMTWDPDQERVLHPGHADAHHCEAPESPSHPWVELDEVLSDVPRHESPHAAVILARHHEDDIGTLHLPEAPGKATRGPREAGEHSGVGDEADVLAGHLTPVVHAETGYVAEVGVWMLVSEPADLVTLGAAPGGRHQQTRGQALGV